MAWLVRSALFGAAIVLSSCAEQPTLEPIAAEDVASVVGLVRQDLRYYFAHENANEKDLMKRLGTGQTQTATTICGAGILAFRVSEIDVELTTTLDTTSSKTASATPSSSTAAAVAPTKIVLGYDKKHEISNSEVIDFSFYPAVDAGAADKAMPASDEQMSASKNSNQRQGKTPISDAIFAVSNGLVSARAEGTPCLSTVPANTKVPGKYETDLSRLPANKVTLSLKVVKDRNGHLKLAFGMMDLSAGREIKSATGNTVTVKFTPVVLEAPSPARGGGGIECWGKSGAIRNGNEFFISPCLP
jgi:hypothetical protein